MENIMYKRFTDVKMVKICELKTVVDPKDPVLCMLQLMFDTIKKEIKQKYVINENKDLRIEMFISFSEPKEWRKD